MFFAQGARFRALMSVIVARLALLFAAGTSALTGTAAAKDLGSVSCVAEFRSDYAEYRDGPLKAWFRDGEPVGEYWWYHEEDPPRNRVRVLVGPAFIVDRKIVDCAAASGDAVAKYFLIIDTAITARGSQVIGIDAPVLKRARTELRRLISSDQRHQKSCHFFRYDCKVGLPEAWYASGLMSACLQDVRAAREAWTVAAEQRVRHASSDLRKRSGADDFNIFCPLTRAAGATIR